MLESVSGNFDYVLFMRPDVKYLNKFDIRFFTMLNEKTIAVPRFHVWSNMNDRFCLSNMKNAIVYGKLFDYMLEYSKTKPLHSETFHYDILNGIHKMKIIYNSVTTIF